MGHAYSGRTTIIGCTVLRNAIDGIHDGGGSTIVNNSIEVNGNDGIELTFGSLVLANTCHRNGRTTPDGAGVRAVALGIAGANRIEGNNLTRNDTGLRVENTRNLVIKNSAQGNGTDYNVATGNDVGPIGTAAASASPWANISLY